MCIGTLAGLPFWARMDSPLVLLPAGLFLTFKLFWWRLWSQLTVLVIPALTLPIIWMVYMKAVTGSAFATSGAALRSHRDLSDSGLVPADQMAQTTWKVGLFSQTLSKTPPMVEVVFVMVGMIATVCALVRLWTGRLTGVTASKRFGLLVTLLGLGLVLWGTYYITFQSVLRRWYFAYVGLGIYSLVIPLLAALFVSAIRNWLVRWAARLL